MLLTFSVCHNLSVHGVSLAKTDVCPTFRTKCWSLLCVSPAKHLMFTQKSMITVILGPKFPLCRNIHNQSSWNEYTMFWSSPQLTILHLLSETIKKKLLLLYTVRLLTSTKRNKYITEIKLGDWASWIAYLVTMFSLKFYFVYRCFQGNWEANGPYLRKT